MRFPALPTTRTIGRVIMPVALSAMVLQGCTQEINLAPGAVDRNDTCGVYLTSISEARKTEINQQVGNAAAGALVGAVLGAAIAGGGRNDRIAGALIGAAAGGLTGYSATYYNQKRKNAQDAQTLLASVNADASREQALVTRTGRAVADLRKCRSTQVAQLSSGIRSGKISRTDGRAQLTALQRRIATDNKVVSAAFNGIGERVDGYVDATAATAQVNRAQVQAASTAEARRARAATPAVSGVVASTNSLEAQDARSRAALDANLQSIEKLLG